MKRLLGKEATEFGGIAGIFAGLPQGVVIANFIGEKISSAKVNPSEIKRIVAEDLESISIPLKDIIHAEGKRAYMVTAYLMIKYNTCGGIRTSSFVFGTAAKKQKSLAKSIWDAKQRNILASKKK